MCKGRELVGQRAEKRKQVQVAAGGPKFVCAIPRAKLGLAWLCSAGEEQFERKLKRRQARFGPILALMIAGSLAPAR